MKGKIKINTDLVHFLEVVGSCKGDVYLYTENGDQLNLKSKLFQYVVIVLAKNKELLENSILVFDPEDKEILSDYLEPENSGA